MVKIIIVLMLWLVGAAPANQTCPCRNEGKCQPTHFSTSCACPLRYIGKYCETEAEDIGESPQYIAISQKFSYFVFAPGEPNLFKFSFDVCMLSNPQDLETLIFLTSDQDDGSPNYNPSILSSAKIKVREGGCMVFSSPYIQIRKTVQEPFWRIIIGVRALPKGFKSYFYRTVPGKSFREVSPQILEDQSYPSKQSLQKLYVSVSYELYKETLTEGVIRIFVKLVIVVGIALALYLFCRIVLFSYGIDARDIHLCIHRWIRLFCRRICPIRSGQKNYRNYLRFKGAQESEGAGLRGVDCAICLQQFQMQDQVQETICRHVYHQNCLQEWSMKNQICPLCRKVLKKSNQLWFKRPFRI